MSDPRNPANAPQRPERPRAEPEIIPPGAQDFRGGYRIYVAQPGPLTIFLALLVALIVLGGIVLLVVGTVLIWIPLVVFLVGAAVIFVYARHYWLRIRRWFARQ